MLKSVAFAQKNIYMPVLVQMFGFLGYRSIQTCDPGLRSTKTLIAGLGLFYKRIRTF